MSLQSAGSDVDLRQQQLEQWLVDQTGAQLRGVAAGSDAGFRRYFRYQHEGRSLIAMDAPPATEDCEPFIRIAEMLAAADVSVPEIIAKDTQRGFLLLTDLGLNTYLDVMKPDDLNQADYLFEDATDALIKLQLISSVNQLPDYDRALLSRELALFPEWYLQRHLGMEINTSLRALLDQLFEQLMDQVLGQPKVFVHRDYMPRNLMPAQNNKGAGVLDFQDAVHGPVSYDIACLFKDAFISWPEASIAQWLMRYWQQALDRNIPVPADWYGFQRDVDFMGAQRHLKVLGIFARICYRDGKERYLQDAPRFFNYLKVVAERQPELTALSSLLHLLEEKLSAEHLYGTESTS